MCRYQRQYLLLKQCVSAASDVYRKKLKMKSYILLENLKFHAFHGVMPQETLVGNEYVVNLKMVVDLSYVFQSDDVVDTINYAEVYAVVKKEMDVPSKLIEHVAYRILKALRDTFPLIVGIELKLSKRNPPMWAQIDCASVVLIDGEL